MTRSTLTRSSLIGAAAAGLVVIAASAPAFAQATTYPQGTDCSSIQNSANQMDCMNQLQEQRQNSNPDVTAPAPCDINNSVEQPNPNPSANEPLQNDTIPQSGGAGNNGVNGAAGTGTGGAVQ